MIALWGVGGTCGSDFPRNPWLPKILADRSAANSLSQARDRGGPVVGGIGGER